MWEGGWKPARCVDILTTSQSVSASGRGWRPTVFLSPRTPTLWASSPARPRPLTTATAPTVNTTWACPACRTTSVPPLPLPGSSTGNMRTEKYTPCLGANNTAIQQPPPLLRKFVLFQHCKIINHLGTIIFPSYPPPSSSSILIYQMFPSVCWVQTEQRIWLYHQCWWFICIQFKIHSTPIFYQNSSMSNTNNILLLIRLSQVSG